MGYTIDCICQGFVGDEGESDSRRGGESSKDQRGMPNAAETGRFDEEGQLLHGDCDGATTGGGASPRASLTGTIAYSDDRPKLQGRCRDPATGCTAKRKSKAWRRRQAEVRAQLQDRHPAPRGGPGGQHHHISTGRYQHHQGGQLNAGYPHVGAMSAALPLPPDPLDAMTDKIADSGERWRQHQAHQMHSMHPEVAIAPHPSRSAANGPLPSTPPPEYISTSAFLSTPALPHAHTTPNTPFAPALPYHQRHPSWSSSASLSIQQERATFSGGASARTPAPKGPRSEREGAGGMVDVDLTPSKDD